MEANASLNIVRWSNSIEKGARNVRNMPRPSKSRNESKYDRTIAATTAMPSIRVMKQYQTQISIGVNLSSLKKTRAKHVDAK
jgi:hypothetical protein